MYRDMEGPTKPVEMLNQVCTSVPVHLILGRKHDVMQVQSLIFYTVSPFWYFVTSPVDVQDALLDPASGRCYASTKYIDDVGHLVSEMIWRDIQYAKRMTQIPQEKPDELGQAIFDTLNFIQLKSML